MNLGFPWLLRFPCSTKRLKNFAGGLKLFVLFVLLIQFFIIVASIFNLAANHMAKVRLRGPVPSGLIRSTLHIGAATEQMRFSLI